MTSPRVPSPGWAEMVRKVYEVDPMICPRCGGRMKAVAFLTIPPRSATGSSVTWN